MAERRPVVRVELADLHCGSSVGLMPPGGVEHPDGIEIRPAPRSKLHPWLWGVYQRLVSLAGERIEHYRGEAEVHIGLYGDLTDGFHHGTHQTLSPKEEIHVKAAVETLKQGVLTLDPDHVFLVAGTPAHTGHGAGLEAAVGHELIAEGYPVVREGHSNRPVWEILEANVNGELVDGRHHGRSGKIPWTRRSYATRYREILYHEALDDDRPLPGLWVRAHVHKSYWVPPEGRRGGLLGLPCFQYGTEYVRRVAIESLPDCGGAVVEIDQHGHIDCRRIIDHPRTIDVRPENIWSNE